MNRYFLSIFMIITTMNIFSIDFQDDIDRWLNRELDSKGFLEELDKIEESLYHESPIEKLYTMAKLDLNRGIIFYLSNKKEYSIKHLELSISNIEKAIGLQERSDFYRVLSEAGSYLMLQKGLSYIIKNSKGVNQNALRALELDPNNIKAEIIVANGLINAPRLFGGNPKKGIKILNRLLEVETITNQDKFNALLALGKEEKDKDYINKALEIYPNNQRAKDLLNSL